ncbi:MAG TPA: cation:proton antiporter, partial [Candidatus Ozemobacteraceae bacterium]|nr:cation:proton antiporter [Candidatus Ozemobacteraceae bacterium]
RWNSRELFMLAVVGLGLGIGYLTHLAGLSLAFGAFVTGLILNESEYGHKAMQEMMPIRDLFSLLFFVSVGMLLDPAVIWQHLYTVVFLTVVVCGGRGLLLAVTAYGFGYRRIIPVAVFFGMLPISEIAFIVIRVGGSAGTLSADIYALILNAVVISMLAGPLAAGLVTPFYAGLRRLWPEETINAVNLPAAPLGNHAIIAGGGKLARYVASALRESGIPYVIIEPLYQSFLDGKALNLVMIYGEPGQDRVLEMAGLERARLVLFTGSDRQDIEEILERRSVGKLSFRCLIQTDSGNEPPDLRLQEVDAIISPDLEGGLEMARRSMQTLGMATDVVSQVLERVRRQQHS